MGTGTEVILLERIKNLGDLGESVKVKPGYARNYLLPKGIAVIANPENLEYFESRRVELEKKAKEKLSKDQKRAEELDNLKIEISARASEEGKLYGSISAIDIQKAIKQHGIDVEKKEIQLPTGPFRSIGDYKVDLHLHHGDVISTIDLSIISE